MYLQAKEEAAIHSLIPLFIKRSWTLGLAESCTGGLLSTWWTSFSGVSAFYKGSVVSYSADIKNRVLDVPLSSIQSHGEVSTVVAQQMARGAKQLLDVDWALSITGIAGPSGGSKEKPVGTVCFAVSGPAFEQSLRKQFDKSLSRRDIQRQAALFALDFLQDAMK